MTSFHLRRKKGISNQDVSEHAGRTICRHSLRPIERRVRTNTHPAFKPQPRFVIRSRTIEWCRNTLFTVLVQEVLRRRSRRLLSSIQLQIFAIAVPTAVPPWSDDDPVFTTIYSLLSMGFGGGAKNGGYTISHSWQPIALFRGRRPPRSAGNPDESPESHFYQQDMSSQPAGCGAPRKFRGRHPPAPSCARWWCFRGNRRRFPVLRQRASSLVQAML